MGLDADATQLEQLIASNSPPEAGAARRFEARRFHGPLGGGVLSGKYSVSRPPGDARGRFYPHFQGAAFERALQGIPILEQVASQRGLTVSQLAIAWILVTGLCYFSIVGCGSDHSTEDNSPAIVESAHLTLR